MYVYEIVIYMRILVDIRLNIEYFLMICIDYFFISEII